jgi:hypothetical protein
MSQCLSYLDISNVSLFQEPYNEASEAIAKTHTKDLMYIKFELLHANTNRNKDTFLANELESSYKTIVNKPINWEHSSEIIGHIYNGEYVKKDVATASDVDTDTDYVTCEGVIYKYKSSDRAMEMASRYEKKKLFFSMETYFENAECSECNKVFADTNDYCSHLRRRYAPDSKSSRILHGLLFGGAGCVDNPADDARGLVLASKRRNIIKDIMAFAGDKFTLEEYLYILKNVK